MGGDGGVTVKRDIMVSKQQKRGLQQDIRLSNHGRTTNCSLSGLPLKKPIVACALGMLYNKEAVLNLLLEMSQLKSNPTPLHLQTDAEKLNRTVVEDKLMQFAHITKLSDLINCVVTMKDERKMADKDGKSTMPHAAPASANHDGIGSAQDITNYIICPITDLPADGSLPLVLFRDCGCVMSVKGIEQINGMAQRVEDPVTGASLRACCLCLKPFAPRYQEGFVPAVPNPAGADVSKPREGTGSDDSDKATKGDDTSGKKDKKAKKEKKKSQAVLDQERLESFPLQDGEEPFIPLIPSEAQLKVLEAIMLAQFAHLGRPPPKLVQADIKRQRINHIDSSVEAQRWVQLDSIGLIKKD